MSRPALEELANTLTLTEGVAGAVQSALLPAGAAGGRGWLAAFGAGYFRHLARLPLLAVAARPGGGYSVGPRPAPARAALLRFAPPYLAAARGGRELRYPIVGGLMTRGAGGHLAFGRAPAGERELVWIAVLAYRPRLGLGPLYLLTQVQLHRLITVAYLRAVVAGPP